MSNYVYVATDGDLLKIGVSVNPHKRMGQHGKDVRLLAHWSRPYARKIEESIKGIMAHACVRGREWFRVSEREMMFEVHRTIRIYDNEQARIVGRSTVREHYCPPFELDWLP